MSVDTRLFALIHRDLSHPWLDGLFQAVTVLGHGAVVAVLALLWLWVRARRGSGRLRREVVPVVVAMGLVALTVDLIKEVWDRPRPVIALAQTDLVREDLVMHRGHSFPSGHTQTAFAIVTILGFLDRRFWWYGTPVAALVGLSRVYLGQHFPSDVLAGALLGVAISLAVGVVARRRSGGDRPPRDPEAASETEAG